MAIVEDNYGAKWMKQILNWIYNKTYPNGYEERLLYRDALMECGLKRSKTIELLNEFKNCNIVEFKDENIYWIDGQLKIDNPKMKPYLEGKKKAILEDKNKTLYDYYVKQCVKDNEEPLAFEEWIKERNKT